ncbi:MAG: Gfo/Idh/MocA family oxidoreductase [Planctomycetes bacterium]|nr:Gfo/Idh/MocA family oxidoreductase [Planctomycetota bacterium]
MSPTDRRSFLHGAAGAAAAMALQPAWSRFGRLQPGRAPVRVAVVGAGRQGRAILTELQKLEGVQVAAVCDAVAGRLRAGARRAAGAAAFADHRALLAEVKDLDAVLVATATDAHRAVAVDAVTAGKHVYCEAPLAHTVAEARAIARAARAGGKAFQVGLLARSDPIYRLAWSFHRAGVLDRIVAARAQDHAKTSWRFPSEDPAAEAALNWRLDPARSAGLPGELGTHQFDVVDWFLGAYPVAVRGRGTVRVHADGRTLADTAHCALRYQDGVELGWSATLGSSYEGRYELLQGSMGAIRLAWTAGWLFKEADAPTQGWEVYANRESFHDDEGITLIADATKLAKQGKLREGVSLPHPPLYYALVEFVNAIRAGTPVACSAEEGLRATVLGVAAQRAVLSGSEVAIDPKELELG